MTISINTITDEAAFNDYLAARNAPRDTITNGVRPNSVKAIDEYDALTGLLAGDMSQFSAYHAQVTAGVLPFIELMKCAMKVMDQTPHLIDQSAAAAGSVQPFGVDISEPLSAADYIAMLNNTKAAVDSVITALSG